MATKISRRSGFESAAPRDVAQRFEAIDNLLKADIEVAVHDVELAEAAVREANESGLAVKIAGLLCGRDLATSLLDGARAALDAATQVAEDLERAAAGLRAARRAVEAAQAVGANPATLVSIDGFWPDQAAHELPLPERLQTIGVAILSRCSAYKAQERGRENAVKQGHEVMGNLERERDGAIRARERSARDGAFGEFIERDRMLLGVPGLPPGPQRRPKWPVLMPRFSEAEEARERSAHAEGAQKFVRMLEAASKGASDKPAACWPLDEQALRTLVVSRPHGLKLVRPSLEGDDPSDRWRAPDLGWDAEQGAPCVSADSAQAFAQEYPTRLPLLATQRGRSALATLSFTPLPRTAANQDMQSHFTTATWDIISGNMVALRNNHCCICGAARGNTDTTSWFGNQGGQRTAAARRVIDVHEAWEFSTREDGMGVQKLTSLLPVCSDCHMVFHVDQVLGDAAAFARRAGIPVDGCRNAALDYVVDRRAAMLEGVVDSPHATAGFLIRSEADLSARLATGVAEGEWIMDLSGMRLLNIGGGDPVLRDGANPLLVAGLCVVDQAGIHLEPVAVDARAAQIAEHKANPPQPERDMSGHWPDGVTAAI